MVLRILFLCRGNVTRSPFFAGYLNHLYRTSELADKIYLDVDSSGLEGKSNRPSHPKILQKGLELGFDLAMYRSKHATFKIMKEMDIIFVVDSKQYKRFEQLYPTLLPRVFHILGFGRSSEYDLLDIEDPSLYDSEEEYEKFYKIAISETERIWEYIKQVYYQAEAAGQEFGPKLFWKSPEVETPKKRRYNFFTKRLFPLCPHCQSKRIRRRKRTGYFQRNIFPLFGGFPYRCSNCGRNSILLVGSEISSRRRSEEKKLKWQRFLEAEEALKRQETDG